VDAVRAVPGAGVEQISFCLFGQGAYDAFAAALAGI